MFLYCLAEALSVRMMDWKKIFNAAKLPFAILFAYWVLCAALVFAHLDPEWHSQSISAAIDCLVIFWAGYRGAKSFGLGYLHAAIVGGILSLVPLMFSFVAIGYLVIALMPDLLGEFFAEILVEGAKSIILCAVLALIGAFVAKKLTSKKKSKKVKK
jgi:hypothetical protein